jgi:hypothetical protein
LDSCEFSPQISTLRGDFDGVPIGAYSFIEIAGDEMCLCFLMIRRCGAGGSRCCQEQGLNLAAIAQPEQKNSDSDQCQECKDAPGI